ncbi:MAG: serine/threonine protein kinase [bacterium]|nr:serine/threonine protein kinase [bacterium]
MDDRPPGDDGERRWVSAHIDAFLDARAADDIENLLPDFRAEHLARPGDNIGPYRLMEVLGCGGFGVVYLAVQSEPVTRSVALKLIKPGMDSSAVIARFEAERQALARMDHSAIAKVLDAGTTPRGLPYFVMEHVAGEAITQFCEDERVGLVQRLELFIRVCEAVQHAHQKGVIHRDIKPGNVLVGYEENSEGGRAVPKVIDFGVAKALHGALTENAVFTTRGQLLGTPLYMSPEQTEPGALDVDTRSDIYSLGVLLYELLTGTLPYQRESPREMRVEEVLRVIREVEPEKPSTRVAHGARGGERRASASRRRIRQLRGDLDWIVMKCLEKSRSRRYETANALAQDVRRYLNDEPVLAGPPSAAYRIGKFMRRNRGAVLATGLVATAVLVGLVGTSIGFVRADLAAARAERRAAELEVVTGFQQSMLEELDPERIGLAMFQRIRDTWRASLASEGRSANEIEAATAPVLEMQRCVNATDVAQATLAETILDRAVDAIARDFVDQPLVGAALRASVAAVYRAIGLPGKALAQGKLALAARRRELGNDHSDTLAAINNVGLMHHELGELEKAQDFYVEALERKRRLLGDEHLETMTSAHNLGSLLRERGRLEEAERCFRELIECTTRVLGEDHPNTLDAVGGMGVILEEQGRFADAEAHKRRALEGLREALGDVHPRTLGAIHCLGCVLMEQGKFSDAERYCTEALAGLRSTLGDDHPSTIAALIGMGTLRERQGRLAEAEASLREAVAGCRRVLRAEHRTTLSAVAGMGRVLERQGRLSESEAYIHEALAGYRCVLGDEHPETLDAVSALGSLLHAQGKLAEAEPVYREALAGRRRVLGEDHPHTLRSINNLGALFAERGELTEAEPFFVEFLAGQKRVLGDDHPDTLTAMYNMGSLLAQQGDRAAALRHYEGALQGRRRVLGDDHPDTLGSIHAMGWLHMERDETADAERYYREALERCRQVLGDGHQRTLLVMATQGQLLARLGRLDEAEPVAREAVAATRRTLPAGDWRIGAALGSLGRLLVARGQLEQAEAVLLEAHEVYAAALGREHERVQRTAGDLAGLYDAWELAEPGAGYGAKAAAWHAELPASEEANEEPGEGAE